MALNKVRIVSNGNNWDTRIYDAETNEPINCVTKVVIKIGMEKENEAILTLDGAAFDITAKAKAINPDQERKVEEDGH